MMPKQRGRIVAKLDLRGVSAFESKQTREKENSNAYD